MGVNMNKFEDNNQDEVDEFDSENAFISDPGEDKNLEQINASIAKQICSEMDSHLEKCEPIQKKSFPRWLRVGGIAFGALLCVCLLLLLTPSGRNILLNTASSYAYGKMNYDQGDIIVTQEIEDDIVEDEVLKENPDAFVDTEVEWDVEDEEEGGRQEDGVTNILLLGEEAIDSGSGRGRTDIMIIATMNTNEKTLKLTSLMRDMLIQIPGYQDNKLNAAYEIGGVPLLFDTIELNFDLKLDGYVKVGFDDFENIINKLGGVQITLTEDEATYLRNTNYISKSEYRDVTEGTQTLNGNQALGYCRIRYIATEDNQLNDYGRTSRQRVVLNAIFEQYKSKSLPELVLMLNDILPLITTDVTQEDFQNYLKVGVTLGLNEIENLRIPADKTFDEGFVRKMAVLIPDLDANIETLHVFIFGNENK
jgi:LCP family protein required for cell wall assembly